MTVPALAIIAGLVAVWMWGGEAKAKAFSSEEVRATPTWDETSPVEPVAEKPKNTMRIWEVQSPDGTVVEIQGDHVPSEQELDYIFAQLKLERPTPRTSPVRSPSRGLSDADLGTVAGSGQPPRPNPKRLTARSKAQASRGPRLAGLEIQSGSVGLYIGEGGDHWIESVLSDGSVIKLEDDSLWQVSPLDVIDSALWLPIAAITVIEGDDSGYPYKLINTDDAEVVSARPLSQ